VEDEDYQLRYERVAGIDVAKAKADVCTRLPPAREGGRRGSRVEEVPATAREVLALAGRLLADRVELVVMEATSDYWRIWFYLLEGAGLRVQLVNSRHARQLTGRPKTDQKDAQWIARLAEMGLLRPSFVPPPEIRALRDLTRARLALVRDRTREWQRLEKLLEGALVKLSSVVHSMSRTKTARDILEAIAAGERNPEKLAALAHGGVTGGRAAVRQALEGMRLGSHHSMLIRVHLDHITLLDRAVAAPGTRSRPPWTPSPPPGAPTRTVSRPPLPVRTRPPWPPSAGSRRSPASAPTSPGRSSPKRAWT
jgi:transposase